MIGLRAPDLASHQLARSHRASQKISRLAISVGGLKGGWQLRPNHMGGTTWKWGTVGATGGLESLLLIRLESALHIQHL